MIRTDRGVSGQEAQSMGLANRLVPKGQALDSGETREGATALREAPAATAASNGRPWRLA